MPTPLEFIKSNFDKFSIDSFFAAIAVSTRDSANRAFVKAIDSICEWKKGEQRPIVKWAANVRRSDYAILDTSAADEYWERLEVMRGARRAALAQQNVYNSSTINVYQELSIASSSSQKPEAVGKRKRANSERIVARKGKRKESVEVDHEFDLGKAWDTFIETADFSGSHVYRLEQYGIIQCGRSIRWTADIPELIYRAINLEDDPEAFPLRAFGAYLKTIFMSPTYGSEECANLIFSQENITEPFNKQAFHFISRILYIYSDTIHDRGMPCNLKESETAYCHNALWPLLRAAVKCAVIPASLNCNFKVGETLLKALNASKKYNADGTVYVEQSGLEILLFESSGAYGTRDRARHVFDHVKASFGCLSMLQAILKRYKDADPALLEEARVLFLHASGKDDCLRLWVMKPAAKGKLVTFERIRKVTIKDNTNDRRSIIDVVKFFWDLKSLLQKATESIVKLKQSNELSVFDFTRSIDADCSNLGLMLKPQLIKPRKNASCNGITDLDPVSFIE